MVHYVKDLKILDGEELVEFYHRAKIIEYEIELQQDQTGQLKKLTRMFQQQLQVIPEYKQKLGDISKGIMRFFQKSTWIHDSIPYSIDKILDELEDADVCTTSSLDSPKDPMVNAGRVGREDICRQQTNRRPFILKEEYVKQQREKREQHRDHQKDCTCLACGYITRELYKLLNGLHTMVIQKPVNCVDSIT